MFYRWDKDSLILNIRVQPRASRTELADIIGDEIRLRLTSAPVDDKANTQLIAYLAKTFGVAKSGISIIAGEKARNKRVRIQQPAKLPEGLIAIEHGYNTEE